MTKNECKDQANRARHASKVAAARCALYSSAFGPCDAMTKQANLDMDVAIEVALRWDRIAEIHPAARAAMIRRGSIPAFMFGYAQVAA